MLQSCRQCDVNITHTVLGYHLNIHAYNCTYTYIYISYISMYMYIYIYIQYYIVYIYMYHITPCKTCWQVYRQMLRCVYYTFMYTYTQTERHKFSVFVPPSRCLGAEISRWDNVANGFLLILSLKLTYCSTWKWMGFCRRSGFLFWGLKGLYMAGANCQLVPP